MNEAVRKIDHEQLWSGEEELSVLTFNLNGETFAIEAIVLQ